ncbi:hypothetical protein L198_05985 [Cryptococcus wingfieldii CBS 7118]|uniref:FAM192A/Fyv6 N-terminal domain-containing protein n=1 Tax=Cryptococcus wingfieldii CBS 7118 TaxID=1295528 RepID=A0A1E3IS77_9TREE|nr:hypothetical protein L198_05985 [Cryptococcus wingfieldii CBS 7118]ODN91467.1 hypothetical protein L198_05985 [Cryptococcus wingfieldii CBS 7118]
MDQSLFQATAGHISSRFQTQEDVEVARENKKKEWEDAYKRIGQEPPPQEPEEEHDGRTLYERLQTQKEIKNEEWDTKMKLSNQWRGLNAEEKRFLQDKEEEKRRAQKEIETRETEELRQYRERLAERKGGIGSDAPPPPTSAPAAKVVAKKVPVKDGKKKDVKTLMKGVVVKKKAKAPVATKPATEEAPTAKIGSKRDASDEGDEGGEDEKRRKVEKAE